MSDQANGPQALGELAKQDEVLAEKLSNALLKQDHAEVVRLAAERGIEITEADFPAANPDIEGQELDEAELEKVAGGDVIDNVMNVHVYCGYAADAECGAFFGIALWNPCGAAKD